MITIEAVKETLREIINDKPEGFFYDSEAEHVHPETGEPLQVDTCTYSTASGEPSCLVGHLIARLLPEEFEELHRREWNHLMPNSAGFGTSHVMGVDFEKHFDRRTRLKLHNLQMYQDRGYSWVHAYEEGMLEDFYDTQD